MPAPFDAVVFDLDGTLVDTAPDLQAHVNAVLGEVGRPELELADVRRLVGGGARTLLCRGLEASGGVPTGIDLDRLYGRFLEHYTADPARRSTVHEGVVPALRALAARGDAVRGLRQQGPGADRAESRRAEWCFSSGHGYSASSL